MRHFNEGKDSSDWAPTSQKVDLKVSESDKSNSIMNLNDLDKLKRLTSKDLTVQDVIKNTVFADKSQKEFAKNYENNRLEKKYQDVKKYYESNDSLTPALEQSGMPTTSKIYLIDENGNVVQETR